MYRRHVESTLNGDKFYIRNSLLPFDEDYTHEFKGHRNIVREEIPPWCHYSTKTGTPSVRLSRSPISRVLCGFLNTGAGGTVYCGIPDDGKILGISLTLYQKDHVHLSLKDTMSRFNPPVPAHLYRLRFVPIFSKEPSSEELKVHNRSSSAPESSRLRNHVLRSHEFCWCDKEAEAKVQVGILSQDFIIEIHIKPFNWHDERNAVFRVTEAPVRPVFENDEGQCYFRRQACTESYSMWQVISLTNKTVMDHYNTEIEELDQRIKELEERSKSQSETGEKDGITEAAGGNKCKG